MERDSFASKFGILVAMAGSAVGLGNLWRFPYLVGRNGGAAFIIIYLLIVAVLALPIMYSEFILGRKAQRNIMGGFQRLAPGTPWKLVGAMCMLCTVMIISFYSVVGGWTIDYMVKALMGQFSAPGPEIEGLFAQSMTAVWSPLIYMTIFISLTGLILLAGVKRGIERYSKVLMPLLFLMVVVIAIRSVCLPGAGGGIEFLFKPDFTKVTSDTFLDALGQAFFSLSIGSGMVFTYGSYVKRQNSIVSISAQAAVTDTLFAVIAGIAIMPAVFAYGISPSEGPGLVFVTLPHIFSQMPFGSVLAVLFFSVLFVAAITSAISLLEVIVAYLIEEFGLRRRVSVLVSVAMTIFLGTFCSLSLGVLSDVKIVGYNIFDLFDKTSANILMPLGALSFVLFAGWKLKKEDFMKEITSDGLYPFTPGFRRYVYWCVKYMAPITVAVILVSGLVK